MSLIGLERKKFIKKEKLVKLLSMNLQLTRYLALQTGKGFILKIRWLITEAKEGPAPQQ
jgi:hypothetical protein